MTSRKPEPKKKAVKAGTTKKSPFGDGSKLVTSEQVRKGISAGDTPLNKVAGRWPEFMMLDKEKLCIDLEYQRSHFHPLIKDIASKFNREWFQACIVSDRGNGTFAIMEGGQRWGAALLRDNTEIQYIPCLVYRFDNIKQEAGVFDVINKKRKTITGVERFMALVAQGFPDSVQLHNTITDSGFILNGSHATPDSFSCIGVLQVINRKHLKSRPTHIADLLLLLRCLDDNGAGVFRTIGFVVHGISDVIDLSYSGTVPELNTLQRIFSGINFNNLINAVNADFNDRKTGSLPSRREILRDMLVLECKGAK